VKKTIILVLLVLSLAIVPAMAEENGAGHSKIGTILGRGLFVTYGFPGGGSNEINVFVGSDWNFNYLSLGANYLFRMVDIDIEGETFPLSLGPQADIRIPLNGSSLKLGILADLRWEYTFKFPLNLFIEVGLGLDLDFGNNVNLGFGWDAGIGIRYVFGMN
jgi:hypothetical protein